MALTSLGSLEGGDHARASPFAAPAPRGDTPGPNGAQVRGVSTVRLKTRTLIYLRLLAVAGQATALFEVSLGLKYPLPYMQCWILVGISAVFNLALMISPASRRAARPWEGGAQIVFDIVQLSWLLYYTGGVTNPFCVMMIIPVTVAVATLPARWAFAIGVISGFLALVLAVTARPFPWGGHENLLPLAYRAGCALALMIGMAVTGGFAFWIASQTSRMELALQVTESVLAREQRLSALGTLAAAAAHELGTPLATISVVAKEMARDAPEGTLREDAWLLLDEAQRCRGILRRLTDTPESADALRERMSLLQFVRELVEPYEGDPVVRAEAVVTGPADMEAPDIWRLTEVFHAMTSIVENAFDFARTEILLTARFDAKTIKVEARDDGPGFAQDIITKLGDPYVTSRPGAEGSRTGHIGMGLGFFIAKTLLERTGAQVEFKNGRPRGAIVSASWPRERIEALEVETVED